MYIYIYYISPTYLHLISLIFPYNPSFLIAKISRFALRPGRGGRAAEAAGGQGRPGLRLREYPWEIYVQVILSTCVCIYNVLDIDDYKVYKIMFRWLYKIIIDKTLYVYSAV